MRKWLDDKIAFWHNKVLCVLDNFFYSKWKKWSLPLYETCIWSMTLNILILIRKKTDDKKICRACDI